jgi:hypothetical protein
MPKCDVLVFKPKMLLKNLKKNVFCRHWCPVTGTGGAVTGTGGAVLALVAQ